MRIGKWTVKDVIQGKPLRHPSHPLFVHFPTALYPAALLFGILSRVREGEAAAHDAWTAGVLLGLGLAGSVGAAVTGLVDWAGMVPGSTKRRRATLHMLVQVGAQALAAGALGLVLVAPPGPVPVGALALLGAAVAAVSVGNWFGGDLVYRLAMRVGGRNEPTPPRPRAREPVPPPGR